MLVAAIAVEAAPVLRVDENFHLPARFYFCEDLRLLRFRHHPKGH